MLKPNLRQEQRTGNFYQVLCPTAVFQNSAAFPNIFLNTFANIHFLQFHFASRTCLHLKTEFVSVGEKNHLLDTRSWQS